MLLVVSDGKLQNIVLRDSMIIKQYFAGKHSVMFEENGFQSTTFNNGVCNTVRYHNVFVEIHNKSMSSGYLQVTQNMEKRFLKWVLVWTPKSILALLALLCLFWHFYRLWHFVLCAILTSLALLSLVALRYLWHSSTFGSSCTFWIFGSSGIFGIFGTFSIFDTFGPSLPFVAVLPKSALLQL